MSETLTASFCERCGTRQEFSAPATVGPLRRTRGFIGGLKNYLVTDDGLSDAMRDAMQLQESAVTAAQLDAFHAAIHLCLDCRQYTCNDCWNTDAGRCLTCAPRASAHADVEGFPSLSTLPEDGPLAATVVPVFEHVSAEPLPADAWPTADHEVYPALRELERPAEWQPVQDSDPLGTPAQLFDSEKEAAEAIPAELAETEATRLEEEAARAAAEQARLDAEEAERAAAAAEQARLDAEEAERAAAAAEQARLDADEAERAAAAAEQARMDEEEEAAQRAEAEATARREEEAAREAHRIAVAAELEAELVAAYTGAMAQLRVVQPSEPAAIAEDEDAEPAAAASASDGIADDAPEADAEPRDHDRPVLRVMGWDDDAETHVAESGAPEDALSAKSSNAMDDRPAADAEPWDEPYAEPTVVEALDEHLEYDEVTAEEALQARIAASAPVEEASAAVIEPQGQPHDWASPPAAEPAAADAAAPAVAPESTIGPAGAGRSIPMRDRVIPLPHRPDSAPRERVAAAADTPEAIARRAQLEQLGLDAASGDEQPDGRVLPFAPGGRRADGGSTLWEASAREIGAAGVAVQNCGGCGLALSASAQFCRRCGTRQAQSA